MQSRPRSVTALPSLRVLIAAAGLLAAGAAGPAQAQYAFDDEILPPRVVAWRLGDRGFTGIGRPRFDGRNYVVEAFDPRGERVRLIVAAEDGAILGRQRLDGPVAVARPVRPAPGYGWTEEEAPRFEPRMAGRTVPPGSIPAPEERGAYGARPLPSVPRAAETLPRETLPRETSPRETPRREPVREAARGSLPTDPAGNPLGLNPDAAGRQTAPRRAARPTPPGEKPAAPRLSDVKPPEKAARVTPEAPEAGLPPASRPEAPKAQEAPARAADLKPAEKPAWQTPPEGKRNVRVIGGATIVPGATEKDGGTPSAQ